MVGGMPILKTSTHVVRLSAATLAVALLAACATEPEDPVAQQVYLETNDPIEPTNRYVFDVDMAVDEVVITPVATIYNDAIPESYRDGIRNFLDNLQMPITILNSALQGDWENTVEASVSFFINTTAGMGGIFDIPGSFGDQPSKEDFGQTLAAWGVGEGPYVVLPLVGPSNARDTVALGVDILTDPLTYLLSPVWSYARSGSRTVQVRGDNQEQFEGLRRTSIDFYAAVRSLYRQDRNNDIANGDDSPFAFGDDF